MAWDASRPVPWRRLVREWLIYVAIMAVVFLLFFRDDSLVGIFAGLLISGPLYLMVGWVLAKLGYERKTLREARSGASGRGGQRSDGRPATPPARPKPAPTRRTGGGSRPGRPRPKR